MNDTRYGALLVMSILYAVIEPRDEGLGTWSYPAWRRREPERAAQGERRVSACQAMQMMNCIELYARSVGSLMCTIARQ